MLYKNIQQTIKTNIKNLFVTFIIAASLLVLLSALTFIIESIDQNLKVIAAANCPENYTLNGTTCERTAAKELIYVCPIGSNLDISNCTTTILDKVGLNHLVYIDVSTQGPDFDSCPAGTNTRSGVQTIGFDYITNGNGGSVSWNYKLCADPMIFSYFKVIAGSSINSSSSCTPPLVNIGVTSNSTPSSNVVYALCIPANNSSTLLLGNGECPVGYTDRGFTPKANLCLSNTNLFSFPATLTDSCPPTFTDTNNGTPAPCLSFEPPSSFTCPPGQYLTNQGTDSCTTCPAGSFCSGGIAATATQCPLNSYCTSGVSTFTSCGIGFSSPPGSTSQTACTANACNNGSSNPPACNNFCSAGQYLTGTSCVPCVAGNHCPGGVNAAQVQCPINSFCPIGAGSPTNCALDYSSIAGSSICSLVTCPVSTPYCAGGNTNSPQVSVSYNNPDGSDVNVKTVAPGETVITRISYDNRTDRELNDVSIKASLPTGFTYIPGSFKHCKIPTVNEVQCATDTKTAATKDAMFTAMTNATASGGLSPATTFYDGLDTGANGTATTSANGILDAGKKRFLNLNSCHYRNPSTDAASFDFLIKADPSYGSDTTNASNTIGLNGCAVGTVSDPYGTDYAINLKSYELSNKKNFFLAQCTTTSNGSNGRFTVWTDADPQLQAFSETTNNAVATQATNYCVNTQPNTSFDSDSSGYKGVQLLGNRYLNLNHCLYINAAINRITTVLDNTTNSDNVNLNFKAPFTATNNPIISNSCGIPGIGGGFSEANFAAKAIDTLDNTRARGFFEFQVTVPTTAVQPSYTQTVSMTGKDNTGANISPLIQNGTINTGAVGSTNLNLSIFLSGAFDSATIATAGYPNGKMSKTLAALNLIPTSQPFNNVPYNYVGTEQLPATNRATYITDWVLVEVRDTTTANGGLGNLITRKAAVLTEGGQIVEASNAIVGTSNPGISLVDIPATGDYKIIIRHRNHIPIATKNAVRLTLGGNTTFGFQFNANVKGDNQEPIGVYGPANTAYNPSATPGTTGSYIYGLRKGDATGNNEILAEDRNALLEASEFSRVYDNRDLNLDGDIEATDRTISITAPEAGANL